MANRSHSSVSPISPCRRILGGLRPGYNAEKRGGRLQKVTLDEPLVVTE